MGQTHYDGAAATRPESCVVPHALPELDRWRAEIHSFCADLCAQLASIDHQISEEALSGQGAPHDRTQSANGVRPLIAANVTEERLASLKLQLTQRIAGCQDVTVDCVGTTPHPIVVTADSGRDGNQ